jgi:predicted phosphoribosyltransferase
MVFQSRSDAARQLVKALTAYKGKKPLVLAIPRGAVPMGKIIADALGGELDVVLVHKIGHPLNPEFAIGAVDEEGNLYFDEINPDTVSADYVEAERQRQLQILKNRRERYCEGRSRIDPIGRIVIVVDDGVATGSTFKAAIRALRRQGAKKIVAAFAVGSARGLKEIEKLADDVFCLATPTTIFSVSQFFREFPQISDEEAIAILKGNASPSKAP